MPRKPKVQTRVPEDLHERIEDYCDENDVSKSDAARRALEREYGQLSAARQTDVLRTAATMVAALLGAAGGAAL
jgi:hypothetical protein